MALLITNTRPENNTLKALMMNIGKYRARNTSSHEINIAGGRPGRLDLEEITQAFHFPGRAFRQGLPQPGVLRAVFDNIAPVTIQGKRLTVRITDAYNRRYSIKTNIPLSLSSEVVLSASPESSNALSDEHIAEHLNTLPIEKTAPIVIDMLPHDIVGIFENRTTKDARELVDVFIGKRLRVDVTISDITEPNEIIARDQGMTVTMSFEKEWEDRLSKKKPGDSLVVLGRVLSIQPALIELDHCEIYKPTAAEIITRLSDFAEEGNILLRRNKEKSEPDISMVNGWEKRAEVYIQQNIDEAAAAYFSLSSAPNLYPGLAIHRELVNSIYTRIQRLDKLASEVRER
jgi:hypothetical protein